MQPFYFEDTNSVVYFYRYDSFNVKQREEDSTTVVKVKLPEKAMIQTIERNNIDTDLGWLLEIHFDKKQEIDKSKLLGRRMAHINNCANSVFVHETHNPNRRCPCFNSLHV